jgi:hypothetical protein
LTARLAQSRRLLTAWSAWLAAAGLGALGGTADVTSAPGHGTRVTGWVPGTELA